MFISNPKKMPEWQDGSGYNEAEISFYEVFSIC